MIPYWKNNKRDIKKMIGKIFPPFYNIFLILFYTSLLLSLYFIIESSFNILLYILCFYYNLLFINIINTLSILYLNNLVEIINVY